MKNSLFILLFCAFNYGAQAQHSSLDRISIDGAVLPWGHTLNYSGTLNYEFIKTNHIGCIGRIGLNRPIGAVLGSANNL